MALNNAGAAWPAPAKLNLFLHINGRLPSGYHRLQTLYQLLDWGDRVYVSPREDAQILRTREISGVPEASDLCIRAARLLQAESGSNLGAEIAVDKQIPTGAGLGGGSSDAATVLHALNSCWGCGLSTEHLAEIGLRLGADVPLFVQGYSAWGEGVGEQLQPYLLDPCWYVLLMPGVEISTAEIFNHADLPRDTPEIALPDYRFEDTWNDCQQIAIREYPSLASIIEEVSGLGAWRMTGTGSTFFLRANGQKHAETVTHELNCRYNVRAVRGMNRSPLLDVVGGA